MMGRTLRQREVRRLVWILMGCAVTWQLWRWVPMVPELVAWWDVEPREPAGREAVDGWDPRVLFTPQALLPLVFYAFGMTVTLVLARRFQRLPGFRWARRWGRCRCWPCWRGLRPADGRWRWGS